MPSATKLPAIRYSVCALDCPDACSLLIDVQDGHGSRLRGNPTHPVTRGFLCGKVAKYLDRVYSPDRVLYPVRRVGPKGLAAKQLSFAPHGQPTAAVPTQAEQVWQRITWDEALDEIASRFRAIAAEFGSEAILLYSY